MYQPARLLFPGLPSGLALGPLQPPRAPRDGRLPRGGGSRCRRAVPCVPPGGGSSERGSGGGCRRVRARAAVPLSALVPSSAGASAALRHFLRCILLTAVNNQTNVSSCAQALPGTASPVFTGFTASRVFTGLCEPLKLTNRSPVPLKQNCVAIPSMAQSGREEGKFYHLPPEAGDIESSLEAATGIHCSKSLTDGYTVDHMHRHASFDTCGMRPRYQGNGEIMTAV